MPLRGARVHQRQLILVNNVATMLDIIKMPFICCTSAVLWSVVVQQKTGGLGRSPVAISGIPSQLAPLITACRRASAADTDYIPSRHCKPFIRRHPPAFCLPSTTVVCPERHAPASASLQPASTGLAMIWAT